MHRMHTLPDALARAEAVAALGPDELLALGCLADASGAQAARTRLVDAYGMSVARARAAVRAAAPFAPGLWSSTPLGLITGRSASAGTVALLKSLVEVHEKPEAEPAFSLNFQSVKAAWAHDGIGRFANRATRSGDMPSMMIAAALIAGSRNWAGDSFASGLANALDLPSWPLRGKERAAPGSRVLLCAYVLDAQRKQGLDLGDVHWSHGSASWRGRVAARLLPCIEAGQTTAVVQLLDAMVSKGLSVTAPGSNPLPDGDVEGGMKTASGAASAAEGDLTRWFTRPMWFDGGHEGTQILLTQDDDFAYAWVGRRGRGVLVSFETSTFIGYGLDEPSTGHALALAIGWYVDISISLRVASTSSRAFRRTGTSNAGYTYVPTPNFHSQRVAVANGSATPPRSHVVAAFLRRLPDEREPRPAQVALAPRALQRRMGPQDTFVRSHERGGTAAKIDWPLRLSRYSTLADVLGVISSGG